MTRVVFADGLGSLSGMTSEIDSTRLHIMIMMMRRMVVSSRMSVMTLGYT